MNKSYVLKPADVGKSGSFDRYFEQMYPGLCVCAEKFLGNKDLAEDFVQDVFVKFWQKISSFNSDISVKKYLYTSVRNSCLNYLEHLKVRNKYFEEKLFEVRSEKYFLQEMIETEVQRIIHQAIKELPVKCREILILSLDGLKNPEIADQLNISVNTVKRQKSIAYNHLRKRLQTLYVFLNFLHII